MISRPARQSNLRQVAINTVVAVGGVCLLFRWPAVCAVLMAALFVATLRTWREGRDLGVALAGCVCGVTLELAATGAGLWQYTFPSVAGLPAWVPLLWPTFCIGLPRLAETITGGAPSTRGARATLIGLAILAVEIPVLAVFGNTHPSLLTWGLLVLGVTAFLLAPSRRLLVVLMAGAGFGFACESLPVLLGIWTYPAFGASGMPPWLAPGYAVFGLGVVHLGEGAAGVLTGPPRPRSRVPS